VKPTADEVRALLDYAPESGLFTWRLPAQGRKVGSPAGSDIRAIGRVIRVHGKTYVGSQLAWCYMTGAWPPGPISHIDGNLYNNAWDNLTPRKQRKAKTELTHEDLLRLLSYDSESGLFTRKRRVGGTSFGRPLTSINDQGYVIVGILGRTYRAHRLAWFYVHGTMPEQEIDHINRVRSDNRIANLRMASSGQNKQNCLIRSDNTSGHRGVTKKRDKWEAVIYVNRTKIRLGVFPSLELAAAAYDLARSQHHTHAPA